MRGARGPGLRRWGPATAVALACHALLLWWLARGPATAADRQRAPSQAEAEPAAWAAVASGAAAVTLIDEIPAGLPLEAVVGAGDEAGWDAVNPLPRAALDLPGARAAAPGGGTGGAPSWTGREDGQDLRARVWNDPLRNQIARQRTGETRRSPESIARGPERVFGDRRDPLARRARDGTARGNPGTEDALARATTGAGEPARRWDDADPLLDGALGRREPRRVDGATARPDPALVDRGARATEAPRRGRAADTAQVADASAATDPGLFDLTRASSGGDRAGARGRAGAGAVARGGRGEGATRAAVTAGAGKLAVRAHRHDPYFRRLYRRLDERVEYPRELALGLEQGEVIVRFTLAADGGVSAVTVDKTSGHRALDAQVTGALRAVSPLGRVPAAVLRGRSQVTVLAPYAFRNPIIR